MADGFPTTMLLAVSLSGTEKALLAAGAVVGLAVAFFAGRWALPRIRAWSTRQQMLAGLATVAVLAGAAYAIYTAVDRPEDVVNEDAEFEKEKKKKVIETGNWPVYGYNDQRTRYFPTKHVQPPFASSEWSFQAGKLLEFSPVIGEGVLYFMDKDAVLYAMNAKTGKVLWKKDKGGLSAASPAWADGHLFVVTLEPGNVQRINPRNGQTLWNRDLGARSETSPLIYGDKIIVGNESGTVFALSTRDGSVDWTLDTAGSVKGGVALEGGYIYFGNYAGELYSVRAANGDVKWQTGTQGASFGVTGRIYSTPAVAFGRVYVGSIDNRIYSFEADTGDLAWSKSTGDWVYSAPAVAEVPGAPPTVYIGSKDQNLYALDARNGSTRWQRDIDGVILGAASVVGDVVYVAGIGPNIGTFGFDADSGKQVFHHELGEYNPVISDGARLYLTGTSGIRAFEPLSPREKRRRAEAKREERQKREAKRDRKGDGG
jgi:outer membrane protein assembly factor BamB